ncbi:MAG: glycosyltransferase, partial [Candidatus Omnitrophica bacterium]|nr:glycosyltransferase [Candidatus Omnitrophota bacterium]
MVERAARLEAPVTILMAVHNGAPYLRMALESLLAQTMPQFRLLIVDDASTDTTREVILSFHDPRIELLRVERNVGQTAALNLGLRQTSTPWIARMDADDYAAPQRLEAQLRAVHDEPTLDCVGTCAWVFRDYPDQIEDVIDKPADDAAIKRQLLRVVPMIHGTLLVRRQLLLGVGGYDERYRYSADWDLYMRLLPRCRAANIPRRLMGLRRHPRQGSFTRTSVEENLEIFSRVLSRRGGAPR